MLSYGLFYDSDKKFGYSILVGNFYELSKSTICAICVEPDRLRGNRVGTWVFSRIVLWAKQFDGAIVLPIKIGWGDGNRGKQGEKRKAFYRQFNLKVQDGNDGWAYSEEMNVSELKEVDVNEQDPECCTFKPAHEYIRDLVRERDLAKVNLEQEQRRVQECLEECRELRSELEAYQGSLFFKLWRFCKFFHTNDA